jgi:hypothetical protein
MSPRTKILLGIGVLAGAGSLGIAIVTGNWILPTWTYHKIISAIGMGGLYLGMKSKDIDDNKELQATLNKMLPQIMKIYTKNTTTL